MRAASSRSAPRSRIWFVAGTARPLPRCGRRLRLPAIRRSAKPSFPRPAARVPRSQAGRVSSAGRWLARATELASTDAEQCSVLSVRALTLSDRAHYDAALRLADESTQRAIQLATGVALPIRCRWPAGFTCFAGMSGGPRRRFALPHARDRDGLGRPSPVVRMTLAEVEFMTGRMDTARERLETGYELACRLGDPCWEGMGARATGCCTARGDLELARDWFGEARRRSSRVSDRYVWVYAQSLDAAAGVAIELGDPEASDLVSELTEVAARSGMRELVVRGKVHAGRLGESGALEAARLLAADIDNPALASLFREPVAAAQKRAIDSGAGTSGCRAGVRGYPRGGRPCGYAPRPVARCGPEPLWSGSSPTSGPRRMTEGAGTHARRPPSRGAGRARSARRRAAGSAPGRRVRRLRQKRRANRTWSSAGTRLKIDAGPPRRRPPLPPPRARGSAARPSPRPPPLPTPARSGARRASGRSPRASTGPRPRARRRPGVAHRRQHAAGAPGDHPRPGGLALVEARARPWARLANARVAAAGRTG